MSQGLVSGVKFSELEALDTISGDEVLAVAKDGRSSKVSTGALLDRFRSDLTPRIDSVAAVAGDGVFIMYHRVSDNSAVMSSVAGWPALEAQGNTADGVLIIEGGKYLLVAPTEATNAKSGITYAGIATTLLGEKGKNRMESLHDFEGRNITTHMLQFSEAQGENHAAGYCDSYERVNSNGFGVVAGQWWLPSMGELYMIQAHWAAVNAALSVIKNADLLSSLRYCSSNEGGATSFWAIYGQRLVTNYIKTTTDYLAVRPVSTYFNTPTNIIPPSTAEIAERADATATEALSKIDGQVVGGTNLWLGTNTKKFYDGFKFTSSSGTSDSRIEVLSENASYFARIYRESQFHNDDPYYVDLRKIYNPFYNVEVGTVGVCSFRYRGAALSEGSGFRIRGLNDTTNIVIGYTGECPASDSWRTAYAVFSINPAAAALDLCDFFIFFRFTPEAQSGDYIDIRDVKLEFGNVPTAWSPAPEDLVGWSGLYASTGATLNDYTNLDLTPANGTLSVAVNMQTDGATASLCVPANVKVTFSKASTSLSYSLRLAAGVAELSGEASGRLVYTLLKVGGSVYIDGALYE